MGDHRFRKTFCYSERTRFRCLFKIHPSWQPASLLLTQLWNLSTKLLQQLQRRLLLDVTAGWHQKMHPPRSQNPKAEFSNPPAIRKGGLVSNHMFFGVLVQQKNPAVTLSGISAREAAETELFWGTQAPIHPPLVGGSQLHHPWENTHGCCQSPTPAALPVPSTHHTASSCLSLLSQSNSGRPPSGLKGLMWHEVDNWAASPSSTLNVIYIKSTFFNPSKVSRIIGINPIWITTENWWLQLKCLQVHEYGSFPFPLQSSTQVAHPCFNTETSKAEQGSADHRTTFDHRISCK